jgi:hypothetical protein
MRLALHLAGMKKWQSLLRLRWLLWLLWLRLRLSLQRQNRRRHHRTRRR